MTSLDGEWPFSSLVGIIRDILLSHVTKAQCPCQGIAAAAGRGLAGRALCNLLISSLGLPQEVWPKVEVCQVSNPLEWESSLNRQILKWLWKLPEIIHKYLALSSFPAELWSCSLRKQKPVQTQALLTLDSFYFLCCWWSRKLCICSHHEHYTLWDTLNGFCLQCVWNWVGLATVHKCEQNGITSNLKMND